MHIKEWVSGKWRLVKSNPFLWANLALLVITLMLISWPGPSDLRLRSWGMFLQILGIYTVWDDLTKITRKYDKGHYWRNTWEWLKKFRNKPILAVAGCSALNVSGSSNRATQRRAINSDALLIDRVSALEANIGYIDKDLSSAYREMDVQKAGLERKIAANKQAADTAIRKVEIDLVDAVVGNATQLAFGAAWLAVGVIIATLSNETWRCLTGNCRMVWQALIGQ